MRPRNDDGTYVFRPAGLGNTQRRELVRLAMSNRTVDTLRAGPWAAAASASIGLTRLVSLLRLRRAGAGRMRLPSAGSDRPLSWWREVLFVAVVYSAYEFTRGVHEGGLAAAMANSRRFLDWEDAVHLAPEHVLNEALHGMTLVAVVAAYFYSTMHYLVTPAVLVWMYRSHAGSYRFARTWLAVATVSGLVGFYLIPTAPPRMLAGSGLRDTLADVSHWGWWGGAGSVPRGLGGLSNQFAAMPSLHVGWAVWCGVLIARYATTRTMRTLGWLYPITTSVVVMATGNHYLLDVFGGVAVMVWGACAAVLLRRLQRYLRTRRATAVAVAAPHDLLGGEHEALQRSAHPTRCLAVPISWACRRSGCTGPGTRRRLWRSDRCGVWR